MANGHLSRNPLTLRVTSGRAEAWRYEEPGGLSVVVQIPNVTTVQVRVPGAVMRDYLARKDRPAVKVRRG